jgi:hypothetical protein
MKKSVTEAQWEQLDRRNEVAAVRGTLEVYHHSSFGYCARTRYEGGQWGSIASKWYPTYQEAWEHCVRGQ